MKKRMNKRERKWKTGGKSNQVRGRGDDEGGEEEEGRRKRE